MVEVFKAISKPHENFYIPHIIRSLSHDMIGSIIVFLLRKDKESDAIGNYNLYKTYPNEMEQCFDMLISIHTDISDKNKRISTVFHQKVLFEHLCFVPYNYNL